MYESCMTCLKYNACSAKGYMTMCNMATLEHYKRNPECKCGNCLHNESGVCYTKYARIDTDIPVDNDGGPCNHWKPGR